MQTASRQTLTASQQRKTVRRHGWSPSATNCSDRESTLQEEIKVLEKKLKEQPYVDLRVEAQDVEEVVQKAVKDLIANVEENHAMQTMLRQIERELKEIEEKAKTAKRVTGAIRKRDGSPTNAEDQAIEQKRAAKYGVLKKAQQLKAKNEEEKTMISRFLVNFCRQGRRAELEERLRLRKTELLLEKITKEKTILEERVRSSSGRRLTDENDSSMVNGKSGLERNNSGLLKQRDFAKDTAPEEPNQLAKNASTVSAKIRENSKLEEDGKNSDLSRKGSFRTNVSKRYQEEEEDEEEAEENGGDKESQRSFSRGSYSGLSQTCSQKKADQWAGNEKRKTHDIKSLERLCQPGSTKSTKARDVSNENKKKYFSNTGDQLVQYARKHKSDIFMEQAPRIDESSEKVITSKILYKNHYVLP